MSSSNSLQQFYRTNKNVQKICLFPKPHTSLPSSPPITLLAQSEQCFDEWIETKNKRNWWKINKNRSQFKECQLSNLPNVSHQRLYTADLNNKGQLGWLSFLIGQSMAGTFSIIIMSSFPQISIDWHSSNIPFTPIMHFLKLVRGAATETLQRHADTNYTEQK